MALETDQLWTLAMNAMDGIEAEQQLGDDAEIEAMILIVAVGDGKKTTTHYQFKDGKGRNLSKPVGKAFIEQVLEAIGP